MKMKIYLPVALLFASIISYSQPGSLDLTFDGDGKVTTAIGAGLDDARSVTVQSDGKILVAGYSNNGTKFDFALVRYNTNGLLDMTFGGGDGIVTTSIGAVDDAAFEVVVQNDGKIVIGGYSYTGTDFDFALVRYNIDGSLDMTFGGGDGIVTTDIGASDNGRSLVLQSDGKIILAGYTGNGVDDDFAIARYNTDGSLDMMNFGGGDGIVITPIGPGIDNIRGVALQTDGKIVVAGFSSNGADEDFALARYNMDGSLDVVNFGGGDGIVTTPVGTSHDAGNAVALQSDGKIVIAGRSIIGTVNQFAVVRYNTDGSLDMLNFGGGDGIVTTTIGTIDDNARAVALQSDGKIVAAGFSSNGTDRDFALARYNTDGTLDATFDGDGKVITDFSATEDIGLSLKLSGLRIYVAGYSNNDFAVAAYLNDAFPLPLSLTSFTALKNSNSIELNWKTANEQNTAAFVIERSTDGRNFTSLSTVQSSGNSSSVRNYSFVDQKPLNGTNFYRLKMVDKDGSFTYSRIIAVNMNAITKGLQIFPNPARDILHVQTTGLETITLQIVDAAGKVVKQEKIQLSGNTSFSVEVQSLPKGKYYLVLQRKDGKDIESFVKQ
jgi:uncharacterized delta-60 repeat protein